MGIAITTGIFGLLAFIIGAFLDRFLKAREVQLGLRAEWAADILDYLQKLTQDIPNLDRHENLYLEAMLIERFRCSNSVIHHLRS